MRSITTLVALGLLVPSGCAMAQTTQATQPWTQLSLSTCNVDSFLKANPIADGRGVVIAVMDTGVDPTIPGLLRTSTGEVKVVDVQDFTGQGDVELQRIRPDDVTGKLVRPDDEGLPIEYTPPPVSGAEPIYWFGMFDESVLVNSGVSDVNDNGQTDDQFAICVVSYPGDGDDDAVFYIDTNLDRSFADEKPLKNYCLKYDTFTFHRDKPERQIAPLGFAVNIFLREKKVVIHYDDGAHGTHVAGIAAGWQINDQPGFNGVAPGAKVISLKIGQNAIGGISVTGSMQQAFEYAAKYSREHGVPVVCNLSYGIGSTLEGQSAIDRFTDELLRKNPTMVFCSSAGNEGPGLSSVGTPAAATSIITVAALMAADSARDVMGWTLDGPVVATFSSRGGELPKPDVATPGYATSTVPRWVEGGDFWRGTSMASPYAAGLAALLISHARGGDATTVVRGCDVKQALCLGARPVAGATPLDVGYGVPDVARAADILRELVKVAGQDPLLGYSISTACPHGPGGKAPAAYWRSLYFPKDQPQTFEIEPVFVPGTDQAVRTDFTRRFELVNSSDWCGTPQQHIYLRSDQSARVQVEYRPEKLQEPGVYTGYVSAMHEGREAFRLLNTVIVPHRVSAESNYTLRLDGRQAEGWTPDRLFVSVPPGASAMSMKLTAPPDQRSTAGLVTIFDPEGWGQRNRMMRLNTDEGRREAVWTVSDELSPGVWELCALNDRPDRASPYNLEVRFFGLHAEPTEITSWSRQKPGSPPSGEVTITNVFDTYVPASAAGQIEGFRRQKEEEFTGRSDTVEQSITLDASFRAVRVKLELSKADYAEMTDIGVLVLDSDGEAIHDGAFEENTYEATVRNPSPGAEKTTLTLQITGGFAVEDDERKTPITVKVDLLLAEAISLSVKRGGSPVTEFVPGVPTKLGFSCESLLPATPPGTHPVGYLEFRERGTNVPLGRVPIEIE